MLSKRFQVRGVKMTTCYLAIDIGASSGRIMISYKENQKLKLIEGYRFTNGAVTKNGQLVWPIEELYQAIIEGIKAIIDQGYQPVSLAIDTWAVDFVLLDENNQRLTEAVSYRDHRTDGVMEDVLKTVNKQQLYQKTGIQFQPFNTLYQLKALFNEQPVLKRQAKTFLMIPDYLVYLLTGKLVNEYTNATSTQLVDVINKSWDKALISRLDLPEAMFLPLSEPGTVVGAIKPELQALFSHKFDVILAASHDTASAVMSVPTNEPTIYLSSGTWSLMGVEQASPIISEKALEYNFTNEGGYAYQYRLLKNIMGLWMIQQVKSLYEHRYSFSDLVDMAKVNRNFISIVDVNDQRFLSPENMIDEIKSYCKETNQPIPESPGEVALVIFNSLITSYQQTILEIEELTQKTYQTINIIGGGGKNALINQLLANQSGKEIHVGPTEATAVGNIIAQMIALGDCTQLSDAREMIRQSFDIEIFKPQEGI